MITCSHHMYLGSSTIVRYSLVLSGTTHVARAEMTKSTYDWTRASPNKLCSRLGFILEVNTRHQIRGVVLPCDVSHEHAFRQCACLLIMGRTWNLIAEAILLIVVLHNNVIVLPSEGHAENSRHYLIPFHADDLY